MDELVSFWFLVGSMAVPFGLWRESVWAGVWIGALTAHVITIISILIKSY